MRHLLLLIVLAMLATFTSAQVQFLGSPTTTVRNRGNFVSDSLFYLPKRQKLPTDTGAIRYAIADSSVYVWSGYQWSKLGASIDTTIISTRAWRKKGDDSLGAVIATRTDTTLLSTRAWRQKGLDSLAAIEIDGSGTVNYVPKFTATRTLGNSQIFDNGTGVGIGTTLIPGGQKLRVSGGDAGFEGQYLYMVNANAQIQIGATQQSQIVNNDANSSLTFSRLGASAFMTFNVAGSERLRIFANGRVGVNTTTDAGYQFDVAGSIRNTTGANFATSSGGVRIGDATTAIAKLDVQGNISATTDFRFNNANFSQIAAVDGNGAFGGGYNLTLSGLQPQHAATGGISGYYYTGDPNTSSVRFYADSSRAAGTNAAERMRITSSGNIGIGTSSPTERLDVNGRIRARTIDSTSSPINVLTSDVNGVIRKTAPGVLGSGTTNYVAKFTASGTVGNSVIFDDNTNIGIGTTNPAYKLHVLTSSGTVAGFRNSGANLMQILIGNTAADLTMRTLASGDAFIFSDASKYLAFGTNGSTERMRITSDGELLINTTTDVGDYRLQVNGNANFRDDVLIDTNLRVNRHISLDQTPKAWALGNAIEGPQGSTLFVAGGGVQTLANVYYDGSYKYSTSNPGAAMFLLQSGITFATYGSGTANGALTGANEMVYAGGELRVGIADQGTFKLQVADKSYFGDEVQIASTTDLGNYKLQVTGEAIITAGIRTDAPSGGTAATWKLGTVATVSPTSPNRTIEVEIGGTTYYIHAKTTNN